MTPEEPVENASSGIPRRKMLKRIGAGAAIAWTAPILTSFRSPAFAVSGCGCPPADCSNFATCPNTCFCAPHHGANDCICWLHGFCSGIGQNLCANDQDCVNQFGPGWECGDINPATCNLICGGDTTGCFDPTGCTGPQRQGPLGGIQAKR